MSNAVGQSVRVFTANLLASKQHNGKAGIVSSIRHPKRFSEQDRSIPVELYVQLDSGELLCLPECCVYLEKK